MKIRSLLEAAQESLQAWVDALKRNDATARILKGKVLGSYDSMTIVIDVDKSWTVSDPIGGQQLSGRLTKRTDPEKEVLKIIHACEKLTQDQDDSSAEKQYACEPIIRDVMGWLVKTRKGGYERSTADHTSHLADYGSQPCYIWSKDTNDRTALFYVGIVLLDDTNVYIELASDMVSDGESSIPASKVLNYIKRWDGE